MNAKKTSGLFVVVIFASLNEIAQGAAKMNFERYRELSSAPDFYARVAAEKKRLWNLRNQEQEKPNQSAIISVPDGSGRGVLEIKVHFYVSPKVIHDAACYRAALESALDCQHGITGDLSVIE